jgi:tetratricopeptide (TPR) repeat protein
MATETPAHRRLPLHIAGCVALAALSALTPSCAPRRHLAPALPADVALLKRADSLFALGDYPAARRAYVEARDSLVGTPEGGRAQFRLAYLDVFYRNPSANWDSALTEFQRYAAEYPDNDSVELANTWLRVLAALETREEQATTNAKKMGEVLVEQGQTPSLTVKQLVEGENFDLIFDIVRHCYIEKDSLAARIKLLEDVIATIEKNH